MEVMATAVCVDHEDGEHFHSNCYKNNQVDGLFPGDTMKDGYVAECGRCGSYPEYKGEVPEFCGG
jgi:hypothetical protein